MGEVYSQDGGDGWLLVVSCWWLVGAVFQEGKGHVAGAAAEVENYGFGPLENGTEGTGGAGPPPAVDTDGENVVEQVVLRSDGIEHLLDIRGGVLIGRGADGTGSGGALVLGCILPGSHLLLALSCGVWRGVLAHEGEHGFGGGEEFGLRHVADDLHGAYPGGQDKGKRAAAVLLVA